MWERFSYYGMRGLLIFYLTRHFLFDDATASAQYSAYTSLVYLLPLIGGALADCYLGTRKAIAYGAVLLVAGLILGFWQPGFFVTTKLDDNKAQQGVQQILTDEASGYGAQNVSDVKCNNGQNPTVKKGDTFTCEVSIDGTKRQVTVTFQDDKGTYEVGRPK